MRQLLLTAVCGFNNNGHRKMDLLNCSLPVQRTETIATILEKNELPFHIPDNDRGGRSYNCWGYVALNFGWEKNPVWLWGNVMEKHLEENTKPISKDEAMMGDIVVFRSGNGELTHTALLTYELEIICHKPGACNLCVDSMERAISMYGGNISYVRPIR
jgi:hypothetical protein